MSDTEKATCQKPQDELFRFFLIAIAWSWLFNLPRLLASAELIRLNNALFALLGYAAVFGPSVAAFYLTGLRLGREGIRKLWKRGWAARFPKIWLIPSLLLIPAAGILTLLVLMIFRQPIAWEASLPPAMILPVGLLIWLFGAYPEEYGWRGFALEHLQERYSPWAASLILGVVWGLWHLPLHFITGTTQSVIPVGEFVLQTIVLSVLYTWLYNGTGSSILVASLFHAVGNLTGALIPYWTSGIGRWISFFILIVPAVLVVRYQFTRFLTRLGEANSPADCVN